MTFSTSFPLVAKVGTAHAGFGKMRIQNQSDFEDFRSVCALQDRYVTTEPFIGTFHIIHHTHHQIGTTISASKRSATTTELSAAFPPTGKAKACLKKTKVKIKTPHSFEL